MISNVCLFKKKKVVPSQDVFLFTSEQSLPIKKFSNIQFLLKYFRQDGNQYRYQDLLEPPHDKTNKMACPPSEDSDQLEHSPSLIRVFAVRTKKAWIISYPLSAQQRL